jgi:hypothetical protein
LIQRLDRYLDWRERHRRVKSSRNAALREALGLWLDDQEQRAGFLEPQAQRQQFQNAYHSLNKRHDWVAIHRLRQLMPGLVSALMPWSKPCVPIIKLTSNALRLTT